MIHSEGALINIAVRNNIYLDSRTCSQMRVSGTFLASSMVLNF